MTTETQWLPTPYTHPQEIAVNPQDERIFGRPWGWGFGRPFGFGFGFGLPFLGGLAAGALLARPWGYGFGGYPYGGFGYPYGGYGYPGVPVGYGMPYGYGGCCF